MQWASTKSPSAPAPRSAAVPRSLQSARQNAAPHLRARGRIARLADEGLHGSSRLGRRGTSSPTPRASTPPLPRLDRRNATTVCTDRVAIMQPLALSSGTPGVAHPSAPGARVASVPRSARSAASSTSRRAIRERPPATWRSGPIRGRSDAPTARAYGPRCGPSGGRAREGQRVRPDGTWVDGGRKGNAAALDAPSRPDEDRCDRPQRSSAELARQSDRTARVGLFSPVAHFLASLLGAFVAFAGTSSTRAIRSACCKASASSFWRAR